VAALRPRGGADRPRRAGHRVCAGRPAVFAVHRRRLDARRRGAEPSARPCGRRGAAVSPPARASTCSRGYAHRAEVFVAAVQALALDAGVTWTHGMSCTGWRRVLPGCGQAGTSVHRPAGARLPVAARRGTAAPAQVRRFDQPLVWVAVALLLWGLVMVYSASIAMPDNPRFASYAHALPGAPRCCRWAWALWRRCWRFKCRWQPGRSIAPWLLRRIAGAAGGGADALHWQGRQRRATLDFTGVTEFPALGAGQARRVAVRRRLHGAQDGRQRALLPRRVADGAVRWPSSGLLLLAEPDMGAFMVIAVIAMGILFRRRQRPHVLLIADHFGGGLRAS